MAYNPGISDQSGQFLAQGIGQFAQGISRGMEQHQKRQEENKVLAGQAKALETLLPPYAKLAGIPPEKIEQYLAPSADESPRARVARLSAMAEGIITQATLQAQQQRTAQIQQQMEGERQRQQHEAADRRDQTAQRGRVRAIYGGQPAPEEAAAILQTGGRFEDLAPRSGPPPGVAQLLAAGVDDPRLLAAVERAARPPEADPRLVFQEDPTTGHRFAIGSKGQFANSGTNPAKAPAKQAGVTEVQIGPKRYFYHVESKRYFDEQGQPVAFPAGGDAALVAALGSEAAGGKPGDAGKAGAAAAKPAARAQTAPTFQSPDEVRAAVKAGKLSREEGLKILQKQFNFK